VRELRVAARRPLFLLLVFGCAASILTTGAATARLIWSVPLYWSFLPLTEIAALLAVTWTRRDTIARSTAIDLYFQGYSAWMLYLLAAGLALSSAPASLMWQLLTTVVAGLLVIVITWSAYVDFKFFRTVFGATPRRAVRDVALVRLITWPIVAIVFAVPALTLRGIAAEISEAVREIF
jgi:hypothetical protein